MSEHKILTINEAVDLASRSGCDRALIRSHNALIEKVARMEAAMRECGNLVDRARADIEHGYPQNASLLLDIARRALEQR